MFAGKAFSRNRWVALIGGTLYGVLGILGFFVTSSVPFASPAGGVLFGLVQLNPAQNLVHLAIGAALVGIGLLARDRTAGANFLVGTACFALGYYGLFVIDEPSNVLALNSWGNTLHFASAAVLLAVGLGADLRAASRERTRQTPS